MDFRKIILIVVLFLAVFYLVFYFLFMIRGNDEPYVDEHYQEEEGDVVEDEGSIGDADIDYTGEVEQHKDFSDHEREGLLSVSTTIEKAVDIAEKVVREHSTSYRQRGVEDSLRVVDGRELDRQGMYKVTFTFDARIGGYGPNGDEGGDELDENEERETVVRMIYDRIVNIVTDGVYNESDLILVEEMEKTPEEEHYFEWDNLNE